MWQPRWLNGQIVDSCSKEKALAPLLVMMVGMDRVILLFELSARDGREVAIKE